MACMRKINAYTKYTYTYTKYTRPTYTCIALYYTHTQYIYFVYSGQG